MMQISDEMWKFCLSFCMFCARAKYRRSRIYKARTGGRKTPNAVASWDLSESEFGHKLLMGKWDVNLTLWPIGSCL